jgi:hypothetical protein
MSGPEVSYLAVGDDRDDYGVLPDTGAAFLRDLMHESGSRWQQAHEQADEQACRHLEHLRGCLHRLAMFLLQVSRVAGHAEALQQQRPPPHLPAPPPGMPTLAVAAHEACADFESLLFHGRAALDRLSGFVASQHKQQGVSFRKLPKLLRQAGKDQRAAHALQILGDTSHIEDVLVREPSGLPGSPARWSLRDLVAHKSGVVEGMATWFTIHYTQDQGRVMRLIFDCEALGYPLLGTAQRLAIEVPFIVLNVSAVYLGRAANLELGDLTPPWPNPAVAFSEYHDATGTGPLLTVVRRGLPNGFELTSDHLRPDVLAHAKPV